MPTKPAQATRIGPVSNSTKLGRPMEPNAREVIVQAAAKMQA